MPSLPPPIALCLSLALLAVIHTAAALHSDAALPAAPASRIAWNHTMIFLDYHTCPCCVCFAMDESSSVSNETWTQQINLVLSVIQLHHEFNVERARYAVVSFAKERGSRLIVGLTGLLRILGSLVRGHTRGYGGTDLGAGLIECQRALFATGTGDCEGRTIVLVTDGDGAVPEGILKDIKESGVGVVTVGVGDVVLLPKLQSMATDPAWAFNVSMEAMERLPSVPDDMSWKRRWTPPILTRISTKLCRKKRPFFDFLTRSKA